MYASIIKPITYNKIFEEKHFFLTPNSMPISYTFSMTHVFVKDQTLLKFCEIVAYHLEISNTVKFLENSSCKINVFFCGLLHSEKEF